MKVHFIAIGGTAMHNLAIALHLNGFEVSGSDDEIFEPSRTRLKKYGLLPIEEGWFPEKISADIDFLILGMHAKPENPELVYALKKGMKIYSYPEFLFQHAKEKLRVVVGGSHGKTTITAMVMHVLKKLNRHFDYLVGSKLKDFEVMVQLSSDAPVMVFEGDEYLSSPIDRRPKFHWYKPQIALLSGIAWDHINVFPTFENYLDQFRIFIHQMQTGDTLIYNSDDRVLTDLVYSSKPGIVKIGYAIPEYELVNGLTMVKHKGTSYPLRIFGQHNLMNLNGARLICKSMHISDADFFDAIVSFEGTSNRLECIHKNDRGMVFKDFAHAPSKVTATINAMREQFPDSMLIACLELHTFSSLNRHFLKQYKNSFAKADIACVYFNPHALKMKGMEDLDPAEIRHAFGRDDLQVFRDSLLLFDYLKAIEAGHKAYLLMSSGNFDGINITNISKTLI